MTGGLFLFFLISVAPLVLKEGAVDAAGRAFLKHRNIVVTAPADTIPCDHHNLLNGDHELVEGILKNKLPSGPSGGVGHNYINSVGFEKMKNSNAENTLKMNKLPSGPSGGVGHKYINAAGKASTAQRLITTTPFNKLPSGTARTIDGP